MQARTARIMRFPQPHDPDGRPCLPTHHPRSQPPWPTSPTPTPPRQVNPAPAGLSRQRPRPASDPWPAPPAGRHPGPGRRRGAGRRPVDRRDRRMGCRCASARPGRAGRSPRRPRPLRRPRRGHHPPDPFPPGPDALAVAVGAWLADRDRGPGPAGAGRRRAVAVDGKTLRGAHPPDGDGRPVHLLAAMDHTSRAVLAQHQVGGAPEEVPAFARLLAPLDLADVVVTADALQTHPEAAEFLVTSKQAHYLFVVKANQPTLLDRCQRLAWRLVSELDRTRDR